MTTRRNTTPETSALFDEDELLTADPPNVAGYEGGMSRVDGGLLNTQRGINRFTRR